MCPIHKPLCYTALLRILSFSQTLLLIFALMCLKPSAPTTNSQQFTHWRFKRAHHTPIKRHSLWGMSPEEMGLRPSSSFDEVNLQEDPPSPDDPNFADLNATILHGKLGKFFDPVVMSVNPPRRQVVKDSLDFYRRSKQGRIVPRGAKPDFLDQIDFKYMRLPPKVNMTSEFSSKLKRKIKQFLWGYTSCPVYYKWKDLGDRFWPRYLRDGFCDGSSSCSIPPGMTCRRAESTYKTLLRWVCRPFRTWEEVRNSATPPKPKSCVWIKAEYPILTKCTCGCAPNEDQ